LEGANFPEILLPIKDELDQVEQNINKEMILKAGPVADFTKLELNWWDKYVHPAALIISARMFGYNKPQVITMATVVQLIHIATGIHYGKYDQRPGLPILIGDYFYAKFFSYLCSGKALEWLPEMAEVICDAHDAGVREVEDNQSSLSDVSRYIALLRKQSTLLGTCSAFGVLATNGDIAQEKALRSFGVSLGAAFSLIKQNRCLSTAEQLLVEAGNQLEACADVPPKQILVKLLETCQRGLQKSCLVG
jgi:geranylgeranyl pyrophosphate synthase